MFYAHLLASRLIFCPSQRSLLKDIYNIHLDDFDWLQASLPKSPLALLELEV